ncbi:MAG: MBL fold metallo-hydrolase [Thermodesulfobacteriota bacterium]|nr:MBL fold metallo-hydrolase [Thermodesulfobacteriota bacterium]
MESFRIAKDTYIIDPVFFDVPEFTSVYLLVADTLALFDCGSPKSVPLILDGIRSLGYRPEDVTRIIVSHIHFDHASGAGELLKYMPGATVCVHPKGSKHLVDPSRLTKSSSKVFGEMLDKWYGGFASVQEHRIMEVDDGDTIDIGRSRALRVIATSGHARHGICLYDPITEGLFTGDEAGIYFPTGPRIIPTTPPPDFDPDHNIETIRQLLALNPKMLFFAHYSATPDVDTTLNSSMEILASWKEIVGECIREGLDFEDIVKALRVETAKLLEPIHNRKDMFSWIINHHIPMCAMGYIHYFTAKI